MQVSLLLSKILFSLFRLFLEGDDLKLTQFSLINIHLSHSFPLELCGFITQFS